jgi:hypothetical protein
VAGYENTDDAAAAALFRLSKAPVEHMGLLYQTGDRFDHTPTQSRNRQGEVKGRFNLPTGSLRALFHNHPTAGDAPNSPTTRQFSATDRAEAKRLGVPSYISAGDTLRRYDPITGQSTEVLAQYPIEEMKRQLLARALLK